MNLEKEREAFEAWLKSLNENGRTTYFLGQESTVAWEAWQASANREGYKLAPTEPTKEMLIAADGCVIDGKVTSNNIYKAMIGAIE